MKAELTIDILSVPAMFLSSEKFASMNFDFLKSVSIKSATDGSGYIEPAKKVPGTTTVPYVATTLCLSTSAIYWNMRHVKFNFQGWIFKFT